MGVLKLILTTPNMLKKVLVITMAVAALGASLENAQARIAELKPKVQAVRANIRAMAEECGANEATANVFIARLKEAPIANFSDVMADIRSKNACFADKIDASGAADKLAEVRDRLFAAYERLSNQAVDVSEKSISDVISELRSILNSA